MGKMWRSRPACVSEGAKSDRQSSMAMMSKSDKIQSKPQKSSEKKSKKLEENSNNQKKKNNIPILSHYSSTRIPRSYFIVILLMPKT